MEFHLIIDIRMIIDIFLLNLLTVKNKFEKKENEIERQN